MLTPTAMPTNQAVLRSNMDTLWRGILRGRRKSTADGTLMMFKRFEE
jgi:hypothetical protein